MHGPTQQHISTILEYMSAFFIKVNVKLKDDLKLEDIYDKGCEISPEILIPSIATLAQQLEAVCEKMKSEMKDTMADDVSLMDTTPTTSEKTPNTESEQVENTIDPSIVQIRASNAEIERRIAAFLDQKQSEVNEFNRREFCSWTQLDDKCNDGCARTDAVFVPCAGTKSHIKLTKVVNPYGPQTRHHEAGSSHAPSQVQQASATSGLHYTEERLRNIEKHLSMDEDTSNTDLFHRLKVLEERILYLEGLSPEYFQNAPPPSRRKHRKVEAWSNQNDSHSDITLTDIDAKIQRLKASLKQKAFGDSLS